MPRPRAVLRVVLLTTPWEILRLSWRFLFIAGCQGGFFEKIRRRKVLSKSKIPKGQPPKRRHDGQRCNKPTFGRRKNSEQFPPTLTAAGRCGSILCVVE